MTTGKTTALTRWTFVGKVMSLLFNRLSRLVITFLPGSERLLISWLQSPSAVILEPKIIMTLFPLFPHLFPSDPQIQKGDNPKENREKCFLGIRNGTYKYLGF